MCILGRSQHWCTSTPFLVVLWLAEMCTIQFSVHVSSKEYGFIDVFRGKVNQCYMVLKICLDNSELEKPDTFLERGLAGLLEICFENLHYL